MVVIEQHNSDSESYTNVLETSKLRPEVAPFVPKAQNGQQCYVGFSLDAPEFVPNVYAGNENMYTWVPNQFIVPSTNHPRFSIPRFRDKFIRQHRNRGYNNVNRNRNNAHYHMERNTSHYETEYTPPPPPPHRTFIKIEQRTDRSIPAKEVEKQIQIETKPEPKASPPSEKDVRCPMPVAVVDVPSDIMSYRAALVGNQQPSEPAPKVVETKPVVILEPETKTERAEPRARNDKFVPVKEDPNPPPYKAHFNNRGRPKPTKGSGMQLNIGSLMQASEDKKVKKKKVSRQKTGQVCTKAVNPLDATAPEVRRGKEREDGKAKKLSKMKKIIVKEKCEGNGECSGPIREYCHQVVTPELNSSLISFLSQLREYNDKAYKHGSAHKRRYCCGLREARKYLKLNKVKCIIIPPNIDKIVTKGGLDDCVHDIVNLSSQQNVPIFYGLNKTLISKLLARPKSTITSAVSIFSYHGAESLWKDVLHNAGIARELFGSLQEPDVSDDDASSSDGEEYADDNNEEENEEDNDMDNDSVSSSFVDSGIENNEISSLSLENGHTSGEG